MRIHFVTTKPMHPTVASWLLNADALPHNITYPAPHVITWQPTSEDITAVIREAFVFGPRWGRMACVMTEFNDEDPVRIDYDPSHLLAELESRK